MASLYFADTDLSYISHVKFSLVTNETKSAKLYSCIEVVGLYEK